MSPVVHSGASYVNASVSSVTQAAVAEVCALSPQKQVQLLHAVADAKLVRACPRTLLISRHGPELRRRDAVGGAVEDLKRAGNS
jgi:hypothetical protein